MSVIFHHSMAIEHSWSEDVTLQTRKVGTAKNPWRWVGYAEITLSYEHSSHNSRSEVGNL